MKNIVKLIPVDLIKVIGLLLLVVTVLAVLNIQDVGLKILMSLIGGGAAGLVMATRVFFLRGKETAVSNEMRANIKAVRQLVQNHPIRKSLVDINHQLTGNAAQFSDENKRATLEGLDVLASTKVVISAFGLATLILYVVALHADVQDVFAVLKNMGLQVLAIFLIAIGSLGLFIKIFSTSNFNGKGKQL